MRGHLFVALAVVVLVAPARADDIADRLAVMQARKAAEDLERAARTSGDLAKYVACGQAYLDLSTKFPTSPVVDELVYNAGVCFTHGKSVGAALRMFELLLTRSPRSGLVPRALARTATLYGQLAMFDQAATRAEQYAKKFAAEKDAMLAMSDAVRYRVALGDRAKQLELTTFLIRTYGAKRPEEAAELMWSLTPVYEGAAAVQHLRGYLRTYGPGNRLRGGADRRVLAHAKLGELLWAQACPVASIDGLCAKRAPAVASCTPQPARLVAVPRNAAMVREATANLERAIRLAADTSASPHAQWAAAMAQVTLADRDLEQVLALQLPQLDFDQARPARARRSKEQLAAWLARHEELARVVEARYQAVIARKDRAGAIAATARIGQRAHLMLAHLTGMAVPRDVRTGAHAQRKTAAFCAALDGVTTPLAQRAAEAFERCLAVARDLGIDDAWSRSCQRAGHALDAARIPAADELVPQPTVHTLPIVREPPVTAGAQAPAELTAAIAKFELAARAGWTAAACKDTAAAFAATTRAHPRLVEAPYMLGLVHHACGAPAKAKRAYDQALQLADHAPSRSNLGELQWRAGDLAAARTTWRAALATDAKLFGARVNLAALGLRELRALAGKDPARAKLDAEIRGELAQALAVDDARPEALTLLGLLELDAGKLGLAELLFQQVAQRGSEPVPALLGRGALHARRGAWASAIDRFEQALALDPGSDDARLALALAEVRVRRHDAARDHLAAIQSTDRDLRYDREVAQGIALHHLARAADAEASYQRAIAIDPARAAAHYNVAVHHAALAARDPDPITRKATQRKAAAAYRQAALADPKLDARARAEALDRAIAAP